MPNEIFLGSDFSNLAITIKITVKKLVLRIFNIFRILSKI